MTCCGRFKVQVNKGFIFFIFEISSISLRFGSYLPVRNKLYKMCVCLDVSVAVLLLFLNSYKSNLSVLELIFVIIAGTRH